MALKEWKEEQSEPTWTSVQDPPIEVALYTNSGKLGVERSLRHWRRGVIVIMRCTGELKVYIKYYALAFKFTTINLGNLDPNTCETMREK